MTNNKCKYCGKQFENNYYGFEVFCDKDCLEQYCEEYLKENWREYAYMMGVNLRD